MNAAIGKRLGGEGSLLLGELCKGICSTEWEKRGDHCSILIGLGDPERLIGTAAQAPIWFCYPAEGVASGGFGR